MKTTISTSIKYGNYKHMKHNVDRWSKLVEKHWALVCKALDVTKTKDTEVHWRPIKGTAKATYCAVKNLICMDSRKFDSTKDMIESLGHELTHHRQYVRGELDQEWNNKVRKWMSVWKGRYYKPATTFNAYYNRPWEEEARTGGIKARGAYVSMIAEVWHKNKKALDLTQKP